MLERVTFKCELVAYDNVEETFWGQKTPPLLLLLLTGSRAFEADEQQQQQPCPVCLSVWLSVCGLLWCNCTRRLLLLRQTTTRLPGGLVSGSF